MNLTGYVSAGMEEAKDGRTVFMNANESHLTIDGIDGANFYPEPQPAELLSRMADAYGVKPDNIAISRGADEALGLLTKAFCEPHQDAILIHSPTFGMYAVNANASPVDLIDVPLIKEEDRFVLNTQKIIEQVEQNKNIKLVYVCSPNNPTGSPFPKDDILRIAKAIEGTAILVLDEAYGEFSTDGGLISELPNYPNMVILRTLSKAYGLAGARIGATICHDPDFIVFMRDKILDAYPLPVPAIKAALIALDPANKETMAKHIQMNLSERDRLKAFFEQSKFVTKVYQSDTNFLLVEVTDPKGLAAHCKSHGFVLRDFSDKPSTENCLRISPARAEDNDRFMEVFESYSAE